MRGIDADLMLHQLHDMIPENGIAVNFRDWGKQKRMMGQNEFGTPVNGFIDDLFVDFQRDQNAVNLPIGQTQLPAGMIPWLLHGQRRDGLYSCCQIINFHARHLLSKVCR